jgi:hypothetical protein
VSPALVATCVNNNPTLYYGYAGDQSATYSVKATGGVAPYTISITMNRPLNCNVINSSGDELWTASGGTSVNNVCPASGPGTLAPVSTGTGIASGVNYSVNVTLMQDAVLTATITDAGGCVTTCSTTIHAEDVRCFSGNGGNTKISICHKTGNSNNPCVSMCVNESSLAEHLAHGDFLGTCTNDCMPPVSFTEGPVNNNDKVEEKPVEQNPSAIADEKMLQQAAFNVKVLTNPSDNRFSLLVTGGNNEKIFVTVYDLSGKAVKQVEKNDHQLVVFGDDLKSGYYMAVVRQGNNSKTVRLIKN